MPRKTFVEPDDLPADGSASMRPRPDAAENLDQRRAHRGGLDAASMRPRPDAAENRVAEGVDVRDPALLQ